MFRFLRRWRTALAAWLAGLRPVRWRRRTPRYRPGADRGNLVFFSLLGLCVLAVAAMAWIAYVDHVQSEWQRQRHADLACLARNVYHEARGEPFAGQVAVAEVTLNRVASLLFPDNVCDVVYEKRFDVRRNRLVGAFSWTEIDGLDRPRGRAWRSARKAAAIVYDRQQEATVSGALFYHADRIEPRWAAEKTRVATIGRHVFYE